MAKQTFTTGQVLTAAQMTSLQQTAMGGGSPSTKTTSYVLTAADAGTVIQMNSASATTITVNTALFAAGDSVQIQNINTGVVTITAGTATVTSAGGLGLSQWDGGTLYFTTTSAAIFFEITQTNSPLTTKGDLFTYSTSDARLAVGTSGSVLVSDSAATTGLNYIPTLFAGKNAIINGDFKVNQRSFTSNTTTGTYNFDRWLQANSGGSFTVTPQTFTPGTAPVSGYESTNFLQGITATQSAAGDYAYFTQRIEDVRTNAGTTVVVSFWAKANTGTPKIGVELSQNFGSGGSPSAQVNTAAGSITLSTSWARYSVSVAIPSLSGKTIGTTANTSYLEVNLWTSSGATNATRASSIGIQNFTAGIWGVQLEQGTTATAFQTATGTIQGELAACQRYYFRFVSASNYTYFGNGYSSSTTQAKFIVKLPTTMRTSPSFSATSATNLQINGSAASPSVTSVTLDQANPDSTGLFANCSSGLTAGQGIIILGNNSSAPLFEFTSEL